MLMKDYTAEFLNLEDVIITKVENISDQLHISIELPRRHPVRTLCRHGGPIKRTVSGLRIPSIFLIPKGYHPLP